MPKFSADFTSTQHNFNGDSIPQSPTSDEEYLSDYIQNHRVPLPALNTDDSADEYVVQDDEYPSIASNGTADSDWQENWLFKKKKMTNDITTSSIGMLVPSPMEEVRALIGDRTADEVSDLSEAGSDTESDLSDSNDDEQLEERNSHDLPHILVENKTIIGGKNEMESFGEPKTMSELLQPDSLVSVQSLNPNSPLLMEAKNEMILVDFRENYGNKQEMELLWQSTNEQAKLASQKLISLESNDVQVDVSRNIEPHSTASTEIENNYPFESNELFIDIIEKTPIPAPRYI